MEEVLHEGSSAGGDKELDLGGKREFEREENVSLPFFVFIGDV